MKEEGHLFLQQVVVRIEQPKEQEASCSNDAGDQCGYACSFAHDEYQRMVLLRATGHVADKAAHGSSPVLFNELKAVFFKVGLNFFPLFRDTPGGFLIHVCLAHSLEQVHGLIGLHFHFFPGLQFLILRSTSRCTYRIQPDPYVPGFNHHQEFLDIQP